MSRHILDALMQLFALITLTDWHNHGAAASVELGRRPQRQRSAVL